MQDQIDAVAKAEEDVNALTDSDTSSPLLSETQTAQKAAEEKQREAEEAMKDQIDAVAKAEEDVDALTGTSTSSRVLSEAEEAQRALEQAQAEREAKQDALQAEQDARTAKEKARLDAEEKARLEAEEESKAARAAVAPPPTGLSDDAIEQRKLEQAQMEQAKAALEDAARGEAQKAANMKGAADADADAATNGAIAQSPTDAAKVADAAEEQRKLEQAQMDAAKAALEDAAKAGAQKAADLDAAVAADEAGFVGAAAAAAAVAAAAAAADVDTQGQQTGDGRETAQHEAEEAQRMAEEATGGAQSSTGLTDAEQKELEQAQMDEANAALQDAARASEMAAANQKVIESGMMGAAAAADAAAAKDQHDRAAALGYQEADTPEQESDTLELGSGSGAQEQGSGDTEEGSGDPHEGKVVEWARNLFHNAKPSNSLAKAGLLVHCFDESEEPPGLFKPCVTGWCANQHFDRWWSASIINSKQPNTFGDSGLLLSPAKNLVNCSFVDDVGTMRTGCNTGNSTRYRNGIGKFDRGELKQMMERSMNPEMMLGYNEVLVDSTKFMQRLPRSIYGVIFGLKGNDAFGRVQATQVYVSILDEFNLTEQNHIRLIQVTYDRFERMYNTTGDANWNFTDVSEGAREFLKTHPYEKHRREWLKQHPTIEKHPEMAREYLARQNRREELQDALRQDSRRTAPTEAHIDG